MSRAVCVAGRTSVATLLAVVAVLVTAGAASATTYTVTTTADTTGGSCAPGSCSLRQAVTAAHDGDTITVPAGTYVLSNGQLVLSAAAAINGAGPGSTVLRGGGSDRVMLINGNGGPAVLSGLTITGGDTTRSGGGGLAGGTGGGVTLNNVTVTGNQVTPAIAGFNRGGGGIFSIQSMTLNNSTVSDNSANVPLSDGDSGGGGILMSQTNTGDLTLNNSKLSGNTATVTPDSSAQTDNNGGGGIYMDGHDLTITGTTFANNTSTVNGNVRSEPADGGGGIYQFGFNMRLQGSTVSGNVAHGPGVDKGGGGGVFDDGNTSQYLNSTIANNSTDEPPSTFSPPDADGGGGVLFDGVYGGVVMANMTITGNAASMAAGGGINNNLDSPMQITDSIIAGNTSSSGAGGNCDNDPVDGPAIVSRGYNLTDDPASNNTCRLTGPGDLVGANPHLDALADNGGLTQTEALADGSPAINAGDPSGCTDLVGNPLTTDQRGVARPQPPGGRCDIGAYEATPPLVQTLAASGVTQTSATLNGTVNPDNLATSYHFEYGLTAAYGSSTATQSAGSDYAVHPEAASISGLSPGTTYHYRIVATNAIGTSVGADMTFATASAPSPPKVVKRLKLSVSPRNAATGKRVCYSFTTTSRGRRVSGVTIRFAGRTAHTSRHGKARICESLRHRGVYRARASKHGYRSASARVTVLARRKLRPVFTG